MCYILTFQIVANFVHVWFRGKQFWFPAKVSLGRASLHCRDLAFQSNTLFIREEYQSFSAELAIDHQRSHLRELEIFHINVLKRAPWRDNKSKLRTPDKVLFSIFLIFWTSFIRLCVSYKNLHANMGFLGKIGVVNQGDSAKRSSPGIGKLMALLM